MSTAEKNAALAAIAAGAAVTRDGNAKFRVGQAVVHVRFCSVNTEAPSKFKFNINPNTLSAQWELWVCGTAATYYLIPMSVLQAIYDNPSTYIDRTHPEIRVVSVDARAHVVTYASGGAHMNLKEYLRARLP